MRLVPLVRAGAAVPGAAPRRRARDCVRRGRSRLAGSGRRSGCGRGRRCASGRRRICRAAGIGVAAGRCRRRAARHDGLHDTALGQVGGDGRGGLLRRRARGAARRGRAGRQSRAARRRSGILKLQRDLQGRADRLHLQQDGRSGRQVGGRLHRHAAEAGLQDELSAAAGNDDGIERLALDERCDIRRALDRSLDRGHRGRLRRRRGGRWRRDGRNGCAHAGFCNVLTSRSTSVAASQFGYSVSSGFCCWMHWRTLLSRRMIPASGGSNCRKLRHALARVS